MRCAATPLAAATAAAATNWLDTASDPFAEVYATDAAGKVRGKSFKTDCIEKTLSPVWNETFEVAVAPGTAHVVCQVTCARASVINSARAARRSPARCPRSDRLSFAHAKKHARIVCGAPPAAATATTA